MAQVHPSNAASRAREARFAGIGPLPRGVAPLAYICSANRAGPKGQVSHLEDYFQDQSSAGRSQRGRSRSRQLRRSKHARYRRDGSISMAVVPMPTSAASAVVAAAAAAAAGAAAAELTAALVAASVARHQMRSGGIACEARSRTRVRRRRASRSPTRPARPSRRARHRCFTSWRWLRHPRTAS